MPEINSKYILGGVHHVTAITSSAQKIYDFFTNILGLRLAKLTVNQDDYETYHLYFTDEDGNAGTDITFFDFPGIPQGMHGTNNIERASFRVPSDESLNYWYKRFTEAHVEHGEIETKFEKKALEFVDFDNQQYQLISDENNVGVKSFNAPWQLSNVEKKHAITGLGPVFVKVADSENLKATVTEVFGFRATATDGNATLFEVAEGGNGASLIIEESTNEPHAWQGFGTIHHMALRTDNPESIQYWIDRIQSYRLPNSGLVDRFYFSSEYVRVAPGVLFEIATDTPGIGALQMAKDGKSKVDSYETALITSGFWIDETKEEAGLDLSLPPHLFPEDEATKAKAISRLRPLDTSDALRDRREDTLWTMEKVVYRIPVEI
ncbi:VOC family protein [Lactovum miscens]|uniref:Glyoxalase family protein n=1 Tax=Lactovum miscens TaxID=190387 RepID=A0A841C3U1_9LACT|nr:VOC family protein [Lactovum miscens]MBB5888616.1 glyoxalase family protein [Lactovum miscens]